MYQAKERYRGKIADQYEAKRVRTGKWRREHMVLISILETLPEAMDILDVPVGTGRFLAEYAVRKHNVLGVDISLDMLERAEQVSQKLDNKNSLLLGNAEALPIPDASVDCVICFRLLNWVPLDVFAQLIGEFSRVTRGWMILEIRLKEERRLTTMFTRSTHPKTLLRCGKSVLRFPYRTWHRRTGDSSGETTAKIIVHSESEVISLLRQHQLRIEEVIIVDQGQDGIRGVTKPLKVLLLRKG